MSKNANFSGQQILNQLFYCISKSDIQAKEPPLAIQYVAKCDQ